MDYFRRFGWTSIHLPRIDTHRLVPPPTAFQEHDISWKCHGRYSGPFAESLVGFITLLFGLNCHCLFVLAAVVHYVLHIVAHQSDNALFQNLVSIPIAVVHQVTPCTWELKQSPSRKVGESGELVPSFIARDPVEWQPGILLPAPPPKPVYLDGRAVRAQFMGLTTAESFLSFLNHVGMFISVKAEKLYGWRLKELIGCQRMFAQLAKLPPERWSSYGETLMSPAANVPLGIISALNRASHFKTQFRWGSSLPKSWRMASGVAVIETEDVVSSILATLIIDHLRGARFGVCARRDCLQFFEIISRHDKKYCCQYCAHIESQRRTREKQKREASGSQVQKAKGRAKR